jgi:hypothetical protein
VVRLSLTVCFSVPDDSGISETDQLPFSFSPFACRYNISASTSSGNSFAQTAAGWSTHRQQHLVSSLTPHPQEASLE